MSATPSSRRQTTTTTTDDIEIPPLPPYQPPIAPLIPNCQQKLTNLAKSSALKHLHTHIQHAAEKLTDSAGDVNERLTEVREKALRSRKRNRAQFEDGQQDGDGNRGEENEENEGGEMEVTEKINPIADVKALQLSHNAYECYDTEGRYVRGFDLNGPYCGFAVYSYCDESSKKPLTVLDTYTGKIYKDLYLANLLVRPDFRNMGIGQLILDQTAKFAKDNGFSTIYLWVEEGYWQEEWYRKNGFKSCHSYKEDYDIPAPGVTITSDNLNKKYLWMYKEV